MPDDPRYPQIHITEIVERDGRTFQDPVTSPVCDFCGDLGPSWDYDCHDFVYGPERASAGGWCACTPCSDMIEANDWEGLLERCLMLPRKMFPELVEVVRANALVMWAGFRSHRYGERRPWG